MGSLYSDAMDFVTRYNACTSLVDEQSGWDLILALCATDTGENVFLQVANGKVVEMKTERPPCFPVSADETSPLPGQVIICAEARLLDDILHLRQPPNEPYLFGDLIVKGAEPDFLRLDYIVMSLGARV